MTPALPAPGPALAADATAELAVLGRVTLSLLVVLTLAAVAARVARRMRVGGDESVRVRSRVGLTREATLAVVEVAGRALVLGVTPRSVSLLTSLEPSELDHDPLLTEPPSAPRRTPERPSLARLVESLRDRTARR